MVLIMNRIRVVCAQDTELLLEEDRPPVVAEFDTSRLEKRVKECVDCSEEM
jgi:hypothetical protein